MSYQDIDISELGDLLLEEGLIIIDCRDEQTRRLGQLPGARPASDAVIQRLVLERRANPPVLVYCYHGHASRELCAFLAQLGLGRVYNLNGGWSAWMQGRERVQTQPHNDMSIHQQVSQMS